MDALCSFSATVSWTHSFLLHGDSGDDSTASPAGATTGHQCCNRGFTGHCTVVSEFEMRNICIPSQVIWSAQVIEGCVTCIIFDQLSLNSVRLNVFLHGYGSMPRVSSKFHPRILVELRYHIFQLRRWETGRRCQLCIPIFLFLSIIGRPSCLGDFLFILPSVPVFLETQNLLVTLLTHSSDFPVSALPPNSTTLLSPLAWYTPLSVCSNCPQSRLGACCEEPLRFRISFNWPCQFSTTVSRFPGGGNSTQVHNPNVGCLSRIFHPSGFGMSMCSFCWLLFITQFFGNHRRCCFPTSKQSSSFYFLIEISRYSFEPRHEETDRGTFSVPGPGCTHVACGSGWLKVPNSLLGWSWASLDPPPAAGTGFEVT